MELRQLRSRITCGKLHTYTVADPGLQAEETKVPGPGAGLCPGFTVSRAILADAIALTRGDRFYTHACKYCPLITPDPIWTNKYFQSLRSTIRLGATETASEIQRILDLEARSDLSSFAVYLITTPRILFIPGTGSPQEILNDIC